MQLAKDEGITGKTGMAGEEADHRGSAGYHSAQLDVTKGCRISR